MHLCYPYTATRGPLVPKQICFKLRDIDQERKSLLLTARAQPDKKAVAKKECGTSIPTHLISLSGSSPFAVSL